MVFLFSCYWSKPIEGSISRKNSTRKGRKGNDRKSIDFYISDIYVSFMVLPNLTDDGKDKEIKVAK